MAKRQRKLDPNRFQRQDEQGLLSFDPVRRNTFKWGLIAGAVGGLLMVQVGTIWQILGVMAVVFISNYQIAQATKRIPRWQATVLSLVGAMIAMFGIIALATILMIYFQGGGTAEVQ
ncbi:MAG: hypothetical protein KDJ52_23690 [Anaerolineae bacterium]|nr:hypothetical protein [Anaerolineae bacterium]